MINITQLPFHIMTSPNKIICGSSNLQLFSAIVKQLSLSGVDVSKCGATVERFSDGEIRVELQDSVRNARVFILQSTSKPANDNLMELMLLIDAARRSSAAEIIAVIPYYGYARQDRRPDYSRVPISARVVADMLTDVGVTHIITVDLHATQIQGFFKIPVDNISAGVLIGSHIYSTLSREDNAIIVSPDVGGVARARHIAKRIGDTELDLAIVDKRRPKANVSEVMNIVGDVEDKTCILVDDMIDTAGTLIKASDALIGRGAKQVFAYASHAVFSGEALARIDCSSLSKVVVTDTIPVHGHNPKIVQLSMANILAETIARNISGESISNILS